MLLRHSPSNEAYFYVSQLYADPIFYLIQKTQPGGRMPEADSSDVKKRVSALQPPVRPAASRHKKFQETNSIRLFNRARTKACFFQSRLTRIYARARIPQAVPWLQEFSRKRKLSLAGACLKPTYQPFRYNEYPHSRSRSVLSHTGRHKKDSKKQILSDCLIEYVPASARRVRA